MLNKSMKLYDATVLQKNVLSKKSGGNEKITALHQECF